VGPRAGLDGSKSRPHRDSIPDRPARSSVAVPPELPAHSSLAVKWKNNNKPYTSALNYCAILIAYTGCFRRNSKYFRMW